MKKLNLREKMNSGSELMKFDKNIYQEAAQQFAKIKNQQRVSYENYQNSQINNSNTVQQNIDSAQNAANGFSGKSQGGPKEFSQGGPHGNNGFVQTSNYFNGGFSGNSQGGPKGNSQGGVQDSFFGGMGGQVQNIQNKVNGATNGILAKLRNYIGTRR